MFKSWDELTLREQLLSTISDLHKDVYGVRWRGDASGMSDADLQSFLDSLGESMEREIEYQRQADIEAVEQFEARIVEVIAMGAGDRETALRWIIDAHFDEDAATHIEHDSYYFNYEMHLPTNYNWREGAYYTMETVL